MKKPKRYSLTTIVDKLKEPVLQGKEDLCENLQEELSELLNEKKEDLDKAKKLLSEWKEGSPEDTTKLDQIMIYAGALPSKSTPWHWTLVRLVASFTIVTAVCLSFAIFGGFMMEVFFAFLAKRKISLAEAFLFWSSPLSIMLYAYTASHAVHILDDCMQSPMLCWFNATILQTLAAGKDSVTEWHCTVADILVTLLMRGIPLIGIALGAMSYDHVWTAAAVLLGILVTICTEYVQREESPSTPTSCTKYLPADRLFIYVGLILALLLIKSLTSSLQNQHQHQHLDYIIGIREVIFTTCAGFCTSLITAGFLACFGYALCNCIHISMRRSIEEEARDARVHNLYRLLRLQQVQPGMLRSQFHSIHKYHNQVYIKRKSVHIRCRTLPDLGEKMYWEQRLTVFSVIFWTVVSFVPMVHSHGYHVHFWMPVLQVILMFATVFFTSRWLRHRFKGSRSLMYMILVLTFALVCSLTLLAAAASARHNTQEQANGAVIPMMQAEEAAPPRASRAAEGDGAKGTLRRLWSGSNWSYSFCNMRWGSDFAKLSALDLANLAWIVYAETNKTMTWLLQESFAARREVKLENVTKYSMLPRYAVFYLPPQGGDVGTRVLAVKGTSELRDALMDSSMFSTVKLLQFLNLFFPVLTVMPRKLIEHFIKYTSVRPEAVAVEELRGVANELLTKKPPARLVITGHSLGGALAQIVAGQLGVRAVVWSSPGAQYSALRFNTTVQAMKSVVLNVIPDGDVVPTVDLQAGMVQPVSCRYKGGAPGDARLCHGLLKTACEVWRLCGDPRDFTKSCTDYIDPTELGEMYAHDDDRSNDFGLR